MQDSGSVIAQAAEGHVKKLAESYDVTLKRMYEILSTDCPYPKAVRLAREIGRIDPERLRLVIADFIAKCLPFISDPRDISDASLNRRTNNVIQVKLEGKSIAEQKRALRDGITAMSLRLALLEDKEN